MFKGKTYVDYIEDFLQEMHDLNENLSKMTKELSLIKKSTDAVSNELDRLNSNGISVEINKDICQ